MTNLSDDMVRTIDRAGWEPETVISVLADFIDSKGLSAACEEYLETRLEAEDAMCQSANTDDDNDVEAETAELEYNDEPITYVELMALTFHPGWEDSRVGFQFARFSGPIDWEKCVWAEISWDDNDAFADEKREYSAPLLQIQWRIPKMEATIDVGVEEIHLNNPQVAAMLLQPPESLAETYATLIRDKDPRTAEQKAAIVAARDSLKKVSRR
jgi:hypothetical protein